MTHVLCELGQHNQAEKLCIDAVQLLEEQVSMAEENSEAQIQLARCVFGWLDGVLAV